jgi:hypothetical protein
LTPFYTGFANFALRLEAAGADGLVLFNRFYHPDIDVETLQMLPNLRLSTSAELQLRLHWIATLSEKIRTSLAVTGGVHTALDGIKALLSGAHAVQMVSAVLQQGPKHFKTMEDGVRYWMTRHRFDTIDAFRGRANLTHRADPDEFERSAYRRVLQTWNSRQRLSSVVTALPTRIRRQRAPQRHRPRQRALEEPPWRSPKTVSSPRSSSGIPGPMEQPSRENCRFVRLRCRSAPRAAGFPST